MCENCEIVQEQNDGIGMEFADLYSDIVAINRTLKMCYAYLPSDAEPMLKEGLEAVLERTKAVINEYKKDEIRI